MNPHTAPWIILFLPLFMAAAILFFGQRSKFLSAGLAIVSAAVGCALSWMLFLHPTDFTVGLDWINFGRLLGPDSPFQFTIPIGLAIDSLSRSMLVIVTTIATLVFIYSTAYMDHEEGYGRYFAGLALFLFSMLGIVLADNFVMMFIFWELVGVSSYILIGHYYSKSSAGDAAKQAFIVNRIGDFGFMVGILIFWAVTGTILFSELPGRLGAFEGSSFWLAAAAVLVFCGTVGKSAQFPLHVWLPNSMEGPTPVSSLLHAATMVAAGVYLLARVFPVLEASPDALTVIGWIGAITCFGAGLMGLQQNDIKRILAYSTISQLGYMVLGIAVAPVEGVAMFHLFTHAFFKCMLFLCSGSVILAMHHEQDIWKMGGLWKKTPITFACMAIGGFALMGCPGLSGAFSKDLIIEFAYLKSPALFYLAAGGVFLTALYTTRMLWVTFFGAARSDQAKHAHESPLVMTIPLVLLAIPSLIAGYPFVQEHFFKIAEPEGVPHWVEFAIVGLFAAGVVISALIYRGAPSKDPVFIPFFANRLYLDDLYAQIVRYAQDGTAKASSFGDRWIIGGLVTIGAKGTWAVGFVLRFLQIGNIQAYAFFFGAGVVALLYLLVSK